MDPVTAAMLVLKSFNEFLVTPAGQRFCDRQQAIVDGILGHLHLKIASTNPAPGLETHA